MRFCERCGDQVAADWPYAWCANCGATGTCQHGNRPHDCNDCMILSDLAYDAARESGRIVRRDDDPPEGSP